MTNSMSRCGRVTRPTVQSIAQPPKRQKGMPPSVSRRTISAIRPTCIALVSPVIYYYYLHLVLVGAQTGR
jgi:hypothetical protein